MDEAAGGLIFETGDPRAARSDHRPWASPRLAFTLVGTFASPRAARADEIDDAVESLIDLDQRVHLMSLEFKEAPPPAPDAADRRVLDAQVQLSVKNYDEAATIALDVVENCPTPAYDDALSLLAGTCTRAWAPFWPPLPAGGGGQDRRLKPEQQALQRLVEVALRRDCDVTSTFDGFELYPSAMSRASPTSAPSTSTSAAGSTRRRRCSPRSPPRIPYYFQARYFLATIQVKKGQSGGPRPPTTPSSAAPDEAGRT